VEGHVIEWGKSAEGKNWEREKDRGLGKMGHWERGEGKDSSSSSAGVEDPSIGVEMELDAVRRKITSIL